MDYFAFSGSHSLSVTFKLNKTHCFLSTFWFCLIFDAMATTSSCLCVIAIHSSDLVDLKFGFLEKVRFKVHRKDQLETVILSLSDLSHTGTNLSTGFVCPSQRPSWSHTQFPGLHCVLPHQSKFMATVVSYIPSISDKYEVLLLIKQCKYKDKLINYSKV